jgi:hypothetical protein
MAVFLVVKSRSADHFSDDALEILARQGGLRRRGAGLFGRFETVRSGKRVT